jgi:CheY-like chemotaxis protein
MKPQSDAISGKRILLVEDDRVTRETLRLLLTGDSHTVIEANNGAEAFSLFRAGRFDLVITDYEIPFVKGNELAAQIKQLAPRQPILMITAYPHKSGPDNPVDAVVNKSFTPIRLRGIIAELISAPGENHQSSQAARFHLVSPSFETEIIPA